MYEQFYNLREEPFRLSPDSRLCYDHSTYKKAKSYMEYALHRGEGFIMITGQPGTGKTTLINEITTEMLDSNVVVSTIECSQLKADDLLRSTVYRFGLAGETDHKSQLLNNLENYLVRLKREDKRAVLIVDEAQALSKDAIEELRLLTNLQHANTPLLQIFLIGQEELLTLVHSPQLQQLHQRIIATCSLNSLDEQQTEEYIKYRLERVGWDNDPALDPAIFPFIQKFSSGVPRWINLICSRLLLQGMIEEQHKIGLTEFKNVVEGLAKEQLLPPPVQNKMGVFLSELNELQYKASPKSKKKTTLEKKVSLSKKKSEANKRKRQEKIAKELFTKINPKISAQSEKLKLKNLIKFLNQEGIADSKIELPEDLSKLGERGVLAWMQYSQEDISKETQDIITILLTMVNENPQETRH